jgi:hypothetical protein
LSAIKNETERSVRLQLADAIGEIADTAQLDWADVIHDVSEIHAIGTAPAIEAALLILKSLFTLSARQYVDISQDLCQMFQQALTGGDGSKEYVLTVKQAAMQAATAYIVETDDEDEALHPMLPAFIQTILETIQLDLRKVDQPTLLILICLGQ